MTKTLGIFFFSVEMDDPNIDHEERDIYYTEVGKQDDRIYIGVVSLYNLLLMGLYRINKMCRCHFNGDMTANMRLC